MMIKPAGFLIRFLASTIDGQLFFLPLSITFFLYSSSQDLSSLFYGILIFLAILLTFPLVPIYVSFFTSYFYGPLGKLLTGLRVLDNQGLALSLKRSFFRHTIGYSFSGILFGLGFLAIIKDPQKLAWHDKAVGSRVIINKTLWPLGLFILVFLLGVNAFFIYSGVKIVSSNENLKNEFNNLINDLKTAQASKDKKEVPKDQQPDLENNFAPISSTLKATPSASVSKYSQEDIDSWKKELEAVDKDLASYETTESGSYDQTKLTQLKSILDQMRAIAANIYRKMIANEPLNAKDIQDINSYDRLYNQEQSLLKEILKQ